MTNPFKPVRFAAVIVLMTAIAAQQGTSAPAVSSNQNLLSPNLGPGQSIRWIGRAIERNVENTNHGSIDRFESYTLYMTCSALSIDGNSLTVSRRFNSNGVVGGHETTLPPIIIRKGDEFSTVGKSIRYNPECLFYSKTRFGSPPASIGVGSSWKFNSTTAWGPTQATIGEATIVTIDNGKRTVGIHIVMKSADGRRLEQTTDLEVSDGGIVGSETDQSAYIYNSAIPREIGTPSMTIRWTWKQP